MLLDTNLGSLTRYESGSILFYNSQFVRVNISYQLTEKVFHRAKSRRKNKDSLLNLYC